MRTCRYGFNGQEKSTEINGEGNSYTAEFWQYDARIGRRWNIDPIVKEIESPYASLGNNPINYVDPSGSDTAKAISNSQLVDAIRIASAEVSDAVKNKRSLSGSDVSGRLLDASTKYWEAHQDEMNYAGFSEFKLAVDQYYAGLAETARYSSSEFFKLDRAVINNPDLSPYAVAELTAGRIQEAHAQVHNVIVEGVSASLIVIGARGSGGVGRSPRGAFKSTTLRQIAESKRGATLSIGSLSPTHYITQSRTQMQALLNDIRANGIKEPIKYVEHKGVKYIVDGHHRFYAAQRAGLQNVPVQQVQLPYGGYTSPSSLMLEPGRQPGFWKYIK